MTGQSVWVTGVGAVTGAGVGAPALFRRIFSGTSALDRLEELDGRWGVRAPTPVLGKMGRRLDRSATLMVSAAEEAWTDAGLDAGGTDPGRTDVLEGSSLGCFGALLDAYRNQWEGGPALERPSALTQYMLGAGSARFAEAHGIRGRVLHVSAGSVSAACAIVMGIERVAAGLADVVLAGGAECALRRDVARLFETAGILAGSDGDAPCRPFDRARCGTVLGEGAGMLVLEAAEHARARGRQPRAVVIGAGMTCEAYGMTVPDPAGTGVREAVSAALSGAVRDEIAWIKTHGTGTRLNDAAEQRGLAAVFGDRLAAIPLTSLKPTVGHCLGASGGVEAVAGVLALEAGMIPPTLGTTEVDPELIPCRVPLRPTPINGKCALLLSESFGGRCVALALERPPEVDGVSPLGR